MDEKDIGRLASSSKINEGWGVLCTWTDKSIGFLRYADEHLLVWPSREAAEVAGQVHVDRKKGDRLDAASFAVVWVALGTKNRSWAPMP